MSEFDEKWTEEMAYCTACTPLFDEADALGKSDIKLPDLFGKPLSTQEVRKKYPRFSGTCSKCSFSGIRYASYMHYLCGDW